MAFKINLFEQVQIVTCPLVVDLAEVQQLEEQIQQVAGPRTILTVLDFGETQEFHDECGRIFVKIKNELKKKGRALLSIRVPLKILLQMRKSGMDSVYQPTRGLEEACRKFNIKVPQTRRVDANYINKFVEAILAFLRQKREIELFLMRPPCAKTHEKFDVRTVIGSINLVDSAFTGSIRVAFPAEMAIAIYNVFKGQEKAVLDSDVFAFIASFTQTILTDATARLKGDGLEPTQFVFANVFEISPGMVVLYSAKESAIGLGFDTSHGTFSVDIVSEAIA